MSRLLRAVPAEESQPAAWVAAGAAAASLAHAAKDEDRGAWPAPAAGVAAAEIAAAAVVEEAPAPAAEAPAPAAAEYATEEPVVPDADVPQAASDSVVVVTPGVLEEPLPGSGWESSAVFAEGEMDLEELLPVVADDLLPYEGPQIDAPESTVDEAWDTSGWQEPVPTAVVEPPEMQPEVAVQPEYPAVPAEAAVDAALGEDLKSRIEETRRRIREELEKPFAAVDQEDGADALAGAAVAAQVAGGSAGRRTITGHRRIDARNPRPGERWR